MPCRIPYHKPSHLPEASAVYRSSPDRLETNRFYASTRWRSLRAAFLSEHPLCAECDRKGIVTAALDVHHILERKDYPDLSFMWSNLEALCRPCHNAKRQGGE